jgi:adenylate cyclase
VNIHFDQIVPAIADAGGKILKFMGDAVLAYFRHEGGAVASCTRRVRCGKHGIGAARGGIEECRLRLARRHRARYGKVSYGNIGSGIRLDFTVIGRDVNPVSRIRNTCALSGRSPLMSADPAFRRAAVHIYASLGPRARAYDQRRLE